MPNFDPNDHTTIADFVLSNLPAHKQFALSTVSETGKPWVVCLNLAYDNDINIIWLSHASTEHSKHVQQNPDVAVCVFSETPERGDFGFYCKAIAREVTDEAELAKLLDVRFKQKGKPVPPLTNFLGDAPDRIYFAEIKEAWVNDDRHIKVSVDLNVLRERAKNEVIRL